MFKCSGVDHIALMTNDMEATVQFYSGILGMRVTRTLRTGPQLNNARHYFLDAGGGTSLAFFDGADLPAGIETQRLNHLALKVDTGEEFDEAYQRLKDHNVEVTDVIERRYGKTFYFADPNGIRLQIALETEVWEEDLHGDPEPVPSVRKLIETT